MDDLLNDSYWGLNAKFGHYFLYFDVEVTQVGLDKSFYASEMSKYPFYIGSLN
jgi:hypothetical protein